MRLRSTKLTPIIIIFTQGLLWGQAFDYFSETIDYALAESALASPAGTAQNPASFAANQFIGVYSSYGYQRYRGDSRSGGVGSFADDSYHHFYYRLFYKNIVFQHKIQTNYYNEDVYRLEPGWGTIEWHNIVRNQRASIAYATLIGSCLALGGEVNFFHHSFDLANEQHTFDLTVGLVYQVSNSLGVAVLTYPPREPHLAH